MSSGSPERWDTSWRRVAPLEVDLDPLRNRVVEAQLAELGRLDQSRRSQLLVERGDGEDRLGGDRRPGLDVRQPVGGHPDDLAVARHREPQTGDLPRRHLAHEVVVDRVGVKSGVPEQTAGDTRHKNQTASKRGFRAHRTKLSQPYRRHTRMYRRSSALPCRGGPTPGASRRLDGQLFEGERCGFQVWVSSRASLSQVKRAS